jgi:hypothetical protein
MGVDKAAFRCRAGTGFSRTMKFFTLDRPVGVARACPCSIACRVGCPDVAPLARRRVRRSARVGVSGCVGVGAGSTGSARSPVSAGGVAGDCDSGHRGGDARLCRVCHLGSHGTVGSACPAGDSVPSPEREDVPSGVCSTRFGRPGPPPRRVLHCAGRGADRAAGGRGGRQDVARRAAHGRARRASGVGVRPPRTAGARPARRLREEQRNPLRAKASSVVPQRAADGHDRRHAHPGRDRATDLRHAEIALPDDRQVQPAQAAGARSSVAVGAGAGRAYRAAAPLARPHRDPHAQGGDRATRNRISPRAAGNSDHSGTRHRHRRAQRRDHLRHLQRPSNSPAPK